MRYIICFLLLFLFATLAVSAVTDRAGPVQVNGIEKIVTMTDQVFPNPFDAGVITAEYGFNQAHITLAQTPIPATVATGNSNRDNYTMKDSTIRFTPDTALNQYVNYEVALRDSKSLNSPVTVTLVNDTRSDTSRNDDAGATAKPEIVMRT